MGAVLGAVSPAVVVPRMVSLMEQKYGTKKAIPQMILAGASCDDIFVIVLFTTFLGMAQGRKCRYRIFCEHSGVDPAGGRPGGCGRVRFISVF